MIPASRRRLVVVYALVAALLISLGGRLWYLQVMTGSSYVQLAAQDQTQTVITPAVRGQILDDAGRPLVNNASSLVVTVNMMNLAAQSDGGKAVLRRLATLLGTSDKVLSEKIRLCNAHVSQPCWPGSPYQPIPVAQHVPDAVAVQIMQNHAQFPGVTAGVNPVANYPQPDGANPAQVLGYLGPITAQQVKQDHLPATGFSGEDLVGQAGLEEQYNNQLQGTPGKEVLSVNSAGQQLGTIRTTAPKTGNDLVTSINARLQGDVQNVLAAAIHKAQLQGNPHATTGAAVVLTTTGRVVAMASEPSYNPGIWNGGLSQQQYKQLFGTANSEPVLNRVTQGEYAPGSTFKVTSAAAAVHAGYSLAGTYNCPATYNVGGHSFANDGQPNLGPMSLNEALIVSCDTVFYELAYQIYQSDHTNENVVTSPKAPMQEMQKMEVDWGFGTTPGIDLPEQSAGSIPTREWLYYLWKDNAHTGQDWCKYGNANGSYVQQIEYQDCHYGNVWEPGQAAIAAIGQGYVSVTPLQLANAYAALANGGKLYSPRIGEAVISPSGQVVQKIKPPLVRRLPVAGAALAYIRNALAGVTTGGGTAAGAFSGFPRSTVCVAGKTGTAEVFNTSVTSVFASYAPCNNPKYVVVVMIPDSNYGADVAAPAVRQIYDDIYGLEGHQAAVPGGNLPSALPRVSADGTITAPPGYGG
ncbi:MAG TPA: penicillin-binding protein 2 [Streptosporangiaceae bacterium]|nr:penicillin-binding protein 2 [Streptosporangiaceae bacterium]